MDLRRLGYFLAVVDQGTMTLAAAASFVSQPALSKAIRELEEEVGTPLFDRIGRRVVLTAAGEALVDHARRAIRDVQAGRDAVASVVSLVEGRLDLGCLPTLAAQPTAGLIGRFRADHPRVAVHLADPDDPADLAAMVRNGTVEVAITDSVDVADLVALPLGSEDLVFIVADGAEHRGGASLRSMQNVPMVVSPRGTSSRRKLDEAFAAVGAEVRIAVETAQREATIPLVLAGAGAALVPRSTAATAARLGAVVIEPRPTVTRRIVCLHRGGPLSPAARRFLDLTADPSVDTPIPRRARRVSERQDSGKN